MAMNPMQRKANNYLLIGVLVTLLITGSIIGLLFVQINKLQKDKKKQEASTRSVYIVTEEIKSGDIVSYEKLTQKPVFATAIPEDALSVELTENTIAKIDLKIGTVITDGMVQESEDKTTDDLRKQEYNMVILPSQIQNGDYIDIRIRFSNGVDYIVASKKRVEIPVVGGIESATTISVKMSEIETMVMGNAIIDAYIDEGSLLYATTYVEPGLQDSAIATYVPTGAVQSAMNSNPNIMQEAKNALFTRYNQNVGTRKDVINGVLSQYAQDRVDNIEKGVQEEILRAQEERQLYLESLGGY